MVPRCELRNSECFGNLQEAPQTKRKGTPKRRESARRTGLRILGLIQKIGMVNVHLVVHNYILAHFGRALSLQDRRAGSIPANVSSQSVYGFRKENPLIVLQYEHLRRPQAKVRESIE